MHENARRIYRPSAIRHYYEKRQDTTIPMYLSRRVFVIGWISLLLLLGVGILIANMACPLYFSTRTYSLAMSSDSVNTLTFALLLPTDQRVQAGESLQLIDSDSGQFLVDAVIAAPPQPVSLAQLEASPTLASITAAANQRLYQITVSLPASSSNDPAIQHIGVRVQMGTVPLYSLLGLARSATATP